MRLVDLNCGRFGWFLGKFICIFLGLGGIDSHPAFAGETVAVSIGRGPLSSASSASLSADGRYVAFESAASGLVPNDTNAQDDIFLLDQVTGQITRVSVSTTGAQLNRDSQNPSISADGRYVAFETLSDSVVSGVDSNGVADVYLFDRLGGQTILVSRTSVGLSGTGSSLNPSVSSGGEYVVFDSVAPNLISSDGNGVRDVFRFSRLTGTVTRVSVGPLGESNGASSAGSTSADGSVIAFVSDATNLVSGDTNAKSDIFVRDVGAKTTVRASLSTSEIQANDLSVSPAVSGSGEYVAFTSSATNLVSGDTNGTYDVFRRDLVRGNTARMSVSSSGVQGANGSNVPSISTSGRYVAFSSDAGNLVAGDLNGTVDIFLRDVDTATTSMVSRASTGSQANSWSERGVISPNGNMVVFRSVADNLAANDWNGIPDLFVRNLSSGTTIGLLADFSLAQGNNDSEEPSVSATGSHISFTSAASNLVANDTNQAQDIFFYNEATETVTLASVSSSEVQGDGDSTQSSISDSGRYIAFTSAAGNLVSGDTLGYDDIFVRDTLQGVTSRVSVGNGGSQSNNDSFFPSISGDGLDIAFASSATNLVAQDTNGTRDIFVRNTRTSTTVRVSVSNTNEQANGSSNRPWMAAGGFHVVFESSANNLVSGDTNAFADIFLRDLSSITTQLVSVGISGAPANGVSSWPSVSRNGRFVAFASSASNLVTGDTNGFADIFVRDMVLGTTRRVSVSTAGGQANSSSQSPEISADGTRVVFQSSATNLVPQNLNPRGHVYVHDLILGTTSRASVNSTGSEGNLDVGAEASISGDGAFVGFSSTSNNLSPLGKDSGTFDVYRHQLDGAIKVRLDLQDWIGGSIPDQVACTLQRSDGTVLLSGNYALGPNSEFVLPAPPAGPCEILVKTWVFLQKKVTFNILPGTTELGPISLKNGDADGDNVVSVFDYILISLAFDTDASSPAWDPRADLDGDGAVTVFDYIILSNNFDVEGDY